MGTPQVSVVMPVYNGERYLHEAISSVLKQTVSDFELVVVDDGSTDSSRTIVNEFKQQDERVQLIEQVNMGVAAARNRGISKARAPWVALIDQDDVFDHDKLARQLEFAANHPQAVVIGTYGWRIGAGGRVLGTFDVGPLSQEHFERLRSEDKVIYFLASSVMFRREVVLRVGGFRERPGGTDDVDLWTRLSDDYLLLVLPERLVKYRVHANSVTSNKLHLQRLGTEYLQVNTRRRRSGLHELTWDDFETLKADTPIPQRLRSALMLRSHHAYRTAGGLIADRNVAGFFWLLLSLVLWPPLPIERVRRQVIPWLKSLQRRPS